MVKSYFVDLTGDDEIDETGTSNSVSSVISRQFWKAGNYDIGPGNKPTKTNKQDHMRINPLFLHSNATSHKWVFGAIAELLDNAVDENQNGATYVIIDKLSTPRSDVPSLLIQDDGGGMDPEAIRRCMSFGFSDKKALSTIGQYGNGFKTSSMRLGADVIVFTRHRLMTQSVGLLSYTFLRQMNYDEIVVPMVDYEFSLSARTYVPLTPQSKQQFSSNLAKVLQWSPYLTEDELLQQFDDIGHHGTKVVIYNLWLNANGDLELDFNSDPEDIRIDDDIRSEERKSIFYNHVANKYQYSLRVYASMLYWKLPENFKIILRGMDVQHYNVASDLRYPEIIEYRPHIGDKQSVFTIDIGFLKDAPHVNIHGFCIYHRNRLILPFCRPSKRSIDSRRHCGVVGVLDAGFIRPTHNKQDFEKTPLFQRLEERLRQMTQEYWTLHCEKIGYHAKKKIPLESPSSVNPNTQNESYAMGDDSAGSTRDIFSGSQKVFVNRKDLDPPENVPHTKRHKGSNGQHHIKQTDSTSKRAHLIYENKRLRSWVLELENSVGELNLKVAQLTGELESVQAILIGTLILMYVVLVPMHEPAIRLPNGIPVLLSAYQSVHPKTRRMHRSSSTTRASEEFLVNFSPASLSLGAAPLLHTTAVAASLDHLPVYDPNSDHVTKKEMGLHYHNPSGSENVIHLIPLILILCGFTLWIFSHPAKL